MRPDIQVLGNYQQRGIYYPGRLHAVNGDKCTIHYLDGDKEKDVSTIQILFLPKQTTKTALSAGTCVLVPGERGFDFYAVGTVKKQARDVVTVDLINQYGNKYNSKYQRQQLTVGGLGCVTLITMLLLLVTVTMNS